MATPPGDTWPGVLLQGLITAVVSGLIAGLVARATVWWTQRGDDQAAQLVSSQAAALTLQRLLQEVDHGFRFWLQEPGQRDPFFILQELVGERTKWHNETLIQGPVLTDQHLSRQVTEYDVGLYRVVAGFQGSLPRLEDLGDGPRWTPEVLAWAEAVRVALYEPGLELGDALASHRAGRRHEAPVPPVVVPPLPGSEDRRV